VLLHRQRVHTPEDRFEAQPTPAWGNRGAILFDGRLDDRAGLCDQLGVVPRDSLPDSELVARAFEKWDEDAPSHLVGDFVVVAWHGHHRKAILCADKSGLRPLYYHRAGDLLLFSTVLPALLSVPGVACALDEAVVADLLINNHRDTRQSFFRGISRVLRGTTVTSRGSGEKVAQYWYPASRPPLILRNDMEYVEAAREVLDKAVRCRLRSIAPVPIQASGGFDSCCLMVSVLAQTNTPEVPLFSTVPNPDMPAVSRPHTYASERSAVLAMQRVFPRLATHLVEPGLRPDVEFAPETIFEDVAVPLSSIVAPGWTDMMFRNMRDTGATSFLAGHMGNATLTWDGKPRLGSLFREGHWVRLAAEAAALADHRPRTTAHIIWGATFGPLIPPRLRESGWRGRISLHPRAEAELDTMGRLRASGDRRYAVPRDGTEQRIDMLTVHRALAGEHLGWKRARYGMEMRDPLDDVRLIDFCMSVPEKQFLHCGQTRWLARRLLRDAGVPVEITANTKRGEWCPEWATRLNNRRRGFDLELARLRESPIASRLLDLDLLARVLADWPPTTEAMAGRRIELDTRMVRAFHVGAFIRWAEARPARAATVTTGPLVST
jgi:asparagine synthase (glutamine-hydrolysing)